MMEEHLVDSIGLNVTGTAEGRRDSGSMRNMNTGMREVSNSFALSDPIAFFCECQTATCYSVVWMSAAAFDANIRDRTGWLLTTGHEPSAPWEVAGAPVTSVGRSGARSRQELFSLTSVVVLDTSQKWGSDSADVIVTNPPLTCGDVQSVFDEISAKHNVAGITLRFEQQKDSRVRAIFEPSDRQHVTMGVPRLGSQEEKRLNGGDVA